MVHSVSKVKKREYKIWQAVTTKKLREKKRGNLGWSSDINTVFFFAWWPLPTIHSAVTVETQHLASTWTGARSCSRAEDREVTVSGGEKKTWEGRPDAVGQPDILGFEFLQRRGHVTSLGQTHLSKSGRVSQCWTIKELLLLRSAPRVGHPELWNFHHNSSSFILIQTQQDSVITF